MPLNRSAAWLALACASSALVAAAAEPVEPVEPVERFRLQAQLEPSRAESANARFALRASLQPSATSRREAVGFSLEAGLLAKADISCPPPGFLFGSGFEALRKP